MILQRVEQSEWLSNAYLAVDEIGGTGVLIDSNLATDPLCERVEREGTTITHILLTHHHYDHVVGVEELAERFGGVPVLAHPQCKELVGDAVTGTIDHGDVARDRRPADRGDPHPRALRRSPGAADQRRRLHHRRRDLQGHGRRHRRARARPASATSRPRSWTASWSFPTTSGSTPATASRRRSSRSGRTTRSSASGAASTSPTDERCTVGPGDEDRRDATLLLWAPDYDGGNKALVRFDDDGVETITGGSQVRRA